MPRISTVCENLPRSLQRSAEIVLSLYDLKIIFVCYVSYSWVPQYSNLRIFSRSPGDYNRPHKTLHIVSITAFNSAYAFICLIIFCEKNGPHLCKQGAHAGRPSQPEMYQNGKDKVADSKV